MKSYLSYFILKIKVGLQYRAAALAGISTQFFFGFMYVSIYIAFYESGGTNLPMKLDELVNYTWLVQAFLALVYIWDIDREIILEIKDGNIAYELCRPQDLYWMWEAKILGQRISRFILRFLPILLVCAFIPEPYKLTFLFDIKIFILFIIALILASILSSLFVLLLHILVLYTLNEKGIVNMFSVLADLFSGLLIPIPFFPKFLRNFSNILPFRYITDFPFRLAVGNIGYNEAFVSILIQVFWIIVLIVIGRLLLNKALKKVVVQGG